MIGRALAALLAAALLLIAGAARAEAPVRVASKAFTESVVLGEIALQLAQHAGARAEHRRELGGTRVVWSALTRGDVDVYAEYTGTLREEVFAGESLPDDDALRARLAKEGLAMTEPLGFDNTYAIGLKEEKAAALGLAAISDLARHPSLRLALSAEFASRADGWPALRARYRLPQESVRAMDHDLAYRALDTGDTDVVDLYSTDAEIRHHGLRVLEDDLRHFPAYRAIYVFRRDLEARAPAVVAALRRVGGRIDRPAMIAMNAAAKIDHRPEALVAAELVATLVDGPSTAKVDDRWTRLRRATVEHLLLCVSALAIALPLAIPLGLLAARRPRFGRLVLGATGIVQTIPSLALLVFLLPWLGLGEAPAVAALAMYALLPIVRSTHAGVTGIPVGLTESAEVLGLPPAFRLLRIDLALAMPSVLAGLQIAAVTTVGTATLGALVGAGGYGQAILTGIRLDRVDLILEGAIPAAALAVVVLGLFEVLERALVPRGLRPR